MVQDDPGRDGRRSPVEQPLGASSSRIQVSGLPVAGAQRPRVRLAKGPFGTKSLAAAARRPLASHGPTVAVRSKAALTFSFACFNVPSLTIRMTFSSPSASRP